MDYTWGIPGPLFLLVFGCVLAVPIVGWIVWCRVAVTRAGQPERPVEIYEVAYAAGGSARVIDTAIATLIDGERLRLSKTMQKLSATGPVPVDPIEADVWNAADGASVAEVRSRLDTSDTMTAVAAAAADAGLVVAADRVRHTWVVTAMAYLVIYFVGVLRVRDGMSAGRPVGWLLLLMVVGGLVVGIAMIAVTLSLGNERRTRAGDAAVRAAGLATGVAAAVLAGGLIAYPDELMGSELAAHLAADGDGAHSGAGGGCGCGGCGGGCGGCGGCGG